MYKEYISYCHSFVSSIFLQKKLWFNIRYIYMYTFYPITIRHNLLIYNWNINFPFFVNTSFFSSFEIHQIKFYIIIIISRIFRFIGIIKIYKINWTSFSCLRLLQIFVFFYKGHIITATRIFKQHSHSYSIEIFIT